jgi:hypothetical protein
MLNIDQQNALSFIKEWLLSSEKYAILQGRAGTGKTYLLDTLVNEVLRTTNFNTIIMAPTNEALTQLKLRIHGEHTFKTVYSALGVGPDHSENDLKFKQIVFPSFWDEIHLAIVDEAGLVPTYILELLLSLRIKILFVGHEAQHGPVIVNRLSTDKCISPVFQIKVPSVELSIPKRNVGPLWVFNNYLSDNIEEVNNLIIPSTFDIKGKDLKEYMRSKEGIEDFLSGKTKIIGWRNAIIKRWNEMVRLYAFGPMAKDTKYLPGDSIINIAPINYIPNLAYKSLKEIQNFMKKGIAEKIYVNSKMKVVKVSYGSISLNKTFQNIQIILLDVLLDGHIKQIVEIRYPEDLERLIEWYKQSLYGKGQNDKVKINKEKWYVIQCFANILKSYAITSYRAQGADIKNVIVLESDILKNPNKFDRNKCRYVACSRAKEKLMFYRGVC